MRPKRPMFEPEDIKTLSQPHLTHELNSRDIEVDEGVIYRLFTAYPKETAQPDEWPSFWLLDGNAVFSRLSPDLSANHPRPAIIGTGYPTDLPFDTTHVPATILYSLFAMTLSTQNV